MSSEKTTKVLIAGGSYAGLATAVNLLDKCDSIEAPIPIDITIVDERDGFYHLIGSPLALADKAYASKAWVPYKDVKILSTRPNVRFVHGSMQSVDCVAKKAVVALTPTPAQAKAEEEPQQREQEQFDYDFFVTATGLRRAWPVVPQATTRDAYLEEVGAHIESVVAKVAGVNSEGAETAARPPVLVVGGGAVGIEMAAELKVTQPGVDVVLAHSRDRLLSAEPLPSYVGECAADLCRDQGVQVWLGKRLKQTKKVNVGGEDIFDVEFEDGTKMQACQVIMAMSRSVPATEFLPAEALTQEPGSEGLVRVRSTMQLLPGAANPDVHFAIGDAIHWSGIKRCGGAMHEGKIAATNIHQLLLREKALAQEDKNAPLDGFMELQEIPPMIGLAVGTTAVSYGPPEGMKHGPQVMKTFFEGDLGFRICWDYLRLGEAKA